LKIEIIFWFPFALSRIVWMRDFFCAILDIEIFYNELKKTLGKIEFMYWIYLFIAAIFEIGWPLGFKLAQVTIHKILWISFAVVAMMLSGYFLYIAQRQIPIGTAYAVWTGIAAVCTFIIGVVFFHDAMSMLRFLGIILVVTGIIFLKIGH
jgi:quaternary ammonium compound-resistance protein SugE